VSFLRGGEGMRATRIKQDLQSTLPSVIDRIRALWKRQDHCGLSGEVLVKAYDALGKLYDALDVLVSASTVEQAQVSNVSKTYRMRQGGPQ
jgi:hypothetical protein